MRKSKKTTEEVRIAKKTTEEVRNGKKTTEEVRTAQSSFLKMKFPHFSCEEFQEEN